MIRILTLKTLIKRIYNVFLFQSSLESNTVKRTISSNSLQKTVLVKEKGNARSWPNSPSVTSKDRHSLNELPNKNSHRSTKKCKNT